MPFSPIPFPLLIFICLVLWCLHIWLWCSRGLLWSHVLTGGCNAHLFVVFSGSFKLVIDVAEKDLWYQRTEDRAEEIHAVHVWYIGLITSIDGSLVLISDL